MRLYFTVPDTLQTQNGTLVRNFLRQCAVSTELARAVKFQGGGFFADGASVLANRRVYPGQVLSFDLPPEAGGVAPQPDIAVQVVYEDAFAVVLEKPPHLAVHPTLNYPGGTLANGYAAWALQQGRSPVFRPVNRIDKDTSGLLVVAKTDAAHQALTEQMSVHSIHRVYHAVVYGNLKEDTGFVEAPIGRDPKDRKKMAVTQQNSKYAYTGWQVLERFGNFTYIACKLKTGRTHQIRVHMASIGHPLAGDAMYGPKNCIRSLNGQCLHAKELGFVHPATGEWMQFDSSLPDWFQDYLSRLRKESRHGAIE
mgnify:CR=1 FL=1